MRPTRDQSRPPRCGPFAVPRWDATAGQWVRRLTPEGRDRAADYLTRYPYPAAILHRTYPGLARAALQRFTAEEVHTAACLGVTQAFALFDPTTGYAEATYVVNWIRSAVMKLLRRRKNEPDKFVSLNATGERDQTLFVLAGKEPVRRYWTAAEWEEILDPLDDDQREAVLLVHHRGLSKSAAGRRMGLTPKPFERTLRDAYARIRTARPDLGGVESADATQEVPA